MKKDDSGKYERRCVTENGRVIVWKNIGGRQIPLEECHDDPVFLYHATSYVNFISALSEGQLKPDMKKSGAVSFTANFNAQYRGQIKIVFWRSYLNALPMLYQLRHRSIMPVDEQCGVSWNIYEGEIESLDEKAVDNVIEKMKSDDPESRTDLHRSLIRINPNDYFRECEWLSYRNVPLNSVTVKSVLFVIPIYITKGWVYGNIGCGGGSGAIEIEENASIEDLLLMISDVKDACERYNLPFGGIYTDYSIIMIDQNEGKYIKLDENNLQRMENLEMPVISSDGRNVFYRGFKCKTKEEMQRMKFRLLGSECSF